MSTAFLLFSNQWKQRHLTIFSSFLLIVLLLFNHRWWWFFVLYADGFLHWLLIVCLSNSRPWIDDRCLSVLYFCGFFKDYGLGIGIYWVYRCLNSCILNFLLLCLSTDIPGIKFNLCMRLCSFNLICLSIKAGLCCPWSLRIWFLCTNCIETWTFCLCL